MPHPEQNLDQAEIPGQRFADYRDFPPEFFDRWVEDIKDHWYIKYYRELPNEWVVILKQTWALWIHIGKDPFLLGTKGNLRINEVLVSYWTIRSLVTKWYPAKGKKGSNFLRTLVRKTAPRIIERYPAVQEAVIAAMLLRLAATNHTVPGDPEYKDPSRGTSGIGGISAYTWEPEANPKGLGYTQSYFTD